MFQDPNIADNFNEEPITTTEQTSAQPVEIQQFISSLPSIPLHNGIPVFAHKAVLLATLQQGLDKHGACLLTLGKETYVAKNKEGVLVPCLNEQEQPIVAQDFLEKELAAVQLFETQTQAPMLKSSYFPAPSISETNLSFCTFVKKLRNERLQNSII